MSGLHLVRARLRRDVPAASLARLLVPQDDDARIGTTHQLLWSLFSDGPNRTRDFLWRETERGAYLALSARPPVDAHGLFHLESKPFAPDLRAGQRLGFSLRANPVVSSASGPAGARGKRRDVMMHALYPIPERDRPALRERVQTEAAAGWLARQGALHGFAPDLARLRLEGHDQRRLPRGEGRRQSIAFSVLDFKGVLEVRDPALFLGRLAQGFGAAKAFGCGLMLIRPAPPVRDEDTDEAA